VIFVGFLRAHFDFINLGSYAKKDLLSEELINTVKWVFPAVLLYDGCRTRKHVLMAIGSILVMYLLIAVQVAKRISPAALASGDAIMQGRKVCSDIGYSAVDMSVFLAGASWAIIAAIPLFSKRKHKIIVLMAAGLVVYAQALTGGRAGYLAWGVTGLALCLLKWRKYLILAPVVVILLPIVFPGAAARMFMGVGETDVTGQEVLNDYEATSGRTLIWPYVIDKIGESPVIGYGRLAMNRTGLDKQLMEELGESFPHPHNMYLETLFDNGIIGSIPFLLFWGLLIIYSIKLFISKNRLCSAAGGLALVMMLTQLVAGVGSQHFYPEESTMGVWAAMFLMLRVYHEQLHTRANTVLIEDNVSEQPVYQQMTVSYI
jgi:O-antigen ligase